MTPAIVARNETPAKAPAPLFRTYADLAADPTYRILIGWVGGHGYVMDAVPLDRYNQPDYFASPLPIYRQWYGARPFERMEETP
jgi:hypothetical protein